MHEIKCIKLRKIDIYLRTKLVIINVQYLR